MQKFLSLLKYLDRSKINGSAVQEIAKSFNRDIDAAAADRIATAFRTRGQAGLLSCATELLQLVKPSEGASAPEEDHHLVLTYQCKKCGAMGRIDAMASQLEE